MEKQTLSKKYNYVYLITNLVNGKQYVGKHSTDNLKDGYMGSGKLIRKAEQKYGIENFSKEYLAFCDKEEKLNWFEQYYIKKFKTFGEGYNLTAGGDGWSGGQISDELRKHLSEYRKLHPMSAESHEKTRQKLIGRIVPEESKEKMRKPHGPMSEEHKRKIMESRKIKFNWIDSEGQIHQMTKSQAKRYHPDWKLYE